MRKTYTFFLALIIIALCVSCADEPVNEPTSTPPTDGGGTVYTITDYYDVNGGYSDLGLALDEENGEKTLTVKSGDTLIVGGHSYSVTAEILTIPFYTQPSLDEVVDWWTDYCENRIERGEMIDKS